MALRAVTRTRSKKLGQIDEGPEPFGHDLELDRREGAGDSHHPPLSHRRDLVTYIISTFLEDARGGRCRVSPKGRRGEGPPPQ